MDKTLESASILNDILEIDSLLQEYQWSGHIGRDKAISKIRELRIKNGYIQALAAATLPHDLIPFNRTSDSQLANELSSYKMILLENYLRNMQEAFHANT